MSDRLETTASFAAMGDPPSGGAMVAVVRGLGPGSPVGGPLEGAGAWLEARFAHLVAHFLDFGARNRVTTGEATDPEETVAMTRTGGAVARWISFPRGVRTTTAAMTSGARR